MLNPFAEVAFTPTRFGGCKDGTIDHIFSSTALSCFGTVPNFHELSFSDHAPLFLHPEVDPLDIVDVRTIKNGIGAKLGRRQFRTTHPVKIPKAALNTEDLNVHALRLLSSTGQPETILLRFSYMHAAQYYRRKRFCSRLF
jgi:hypothetical protein